MLSVHHMQHLAKTYDQYRHCNISYLGDFTFFSQHRSDAICVRCRYRAASESLPLFAYTRINTCAAGPSRLLCLLKSVLVQALDATARDNLCTAAANAALCSGCGSSSSSSSNSNRVTMTTTKIARRYVTP